jgi:hypothetical protein
MYLVEESCAVRYSLIVIEYSVGKGVLNRLEIRVQLHREH